MRGLRTWAYFLAAASALGVAQAPPNAAASERLRVVVIVENDAVINAESLKSSAIVMLTVKMPEVQIDDTAKLWLYIAPTCLLDEFSNYSCALAVDLRVGASRVRGRGV